MSLDVYLRGANVEAEPEREAIFVRRDGAKMEISREEWNRLNPDREPCVVTVGGESNNLYSANITHNLNTMAGAAGIYEYLWRPEEKSVTHAKQLIEPLTEGLRVLRAEPEKFEKLNPANGWGDYAGLVNFVSNYLDACKANPDAEVHVWR